MSGEQEHSPGEQQRETAAFIIDLLHRTMVHHVLWFTEVRHQMGRQRAEELLHEVFIVEEQPESFVFRMDECRVQQARMRKGLPDYPCKSAGLVEYSYFARAIDERIVTQCIGCPPDAHPPQWFCAWRFTIE